MHDPSPSLSPPLSLWARVCGSTFEKIHTLGVGCMVLSLLAFLLTHPMSKVEALITFSAFGLGCVLIGWATLCNSWVRWSTGEDQLVLLKKRHPEAAKHTAEIDLLGRRIRWVGPIAHVDTGQISVHPVSPDEPPLKGSALTRSYGLFRAVYWTTCCSLSFQVLFGTVALGYGAWLMAKLYRYLLSSA